MLNVVKHLFYNKYSLRIDPLYLHMTCCNPKLTTNTQNCHCERSVAISSYYFSCMVANYPMRLLRSSQ